MILPNRNKQCILHEPALELRLQTKMVVPFLQLLSLTLKRAELSLKFGQLRLINPLEFLNVFLVHILPVLDGLLDELDLCEV